MQNQEVELTGKIYTHGEWLKYYLNVWQRQLIARIVDVQTDTMTKAINPNMQVSDSDEDQPMPVKNRLEMRKIQVAEAQKIIAAIKVLLAIPEGEFETKTMSKEALAVAPDMIPRKYKVLKQFGQHAPGVEIEMPPVDGQVLVGLGTLEAVVPAELVKKYKVLKDFGDVKAGEILELSGTSAGWTPEQLKSRIDEGTLALAE